MAIPRTPLTEKQTRNLNLTLGRGAAKYKLGTRIRDLELGGTNRTTGVQAKIDILHTKTADASGHTASIWVCPRQNSAIAVFDFASNSADDNVVITVPAAIGGEGGTVTVAVKNTPGSGAADNIRLNRAYNDASTAFLFLLACHGLDPADYGFSAGDIRYAPSSRGQAGVGLKGLHAEFGSTMTEIILTADAAGAVGNTITVTNGAGTIANTTAGFTGGGMGATETQYASLEAAASTGTSSSVKGVAVPLTLINPTADSATTTDTLFIWCKRNNALVGGASTANHQLYYDTDKGRFASNLTLLSGIATSVHVKTHGGRFITIHHDAAADGSPPANLVPVLAQTHAAGTSLNGLWISEGSTADKDNNVPFISTLTSATAGGMLTHGPGLG